MWFTISWDDTSADHDNVSTWRLLSDYRFGTEFRDAWHGNGLGNSRTRMGRRYGHRLPDHLIDYVNVTTKGVPQNLATGRSAHPTYEVLG